MCRRWPFEPTFPMRSAQQLADASFERFGAVHALVQQRALRWADLDAIVVDLNRTPSRQSERESFTASTPSCPVWSNKAKVTSSTPRLSSLAPAGAFTVRRGCGVQNHLSSDFRVGTLGPGVSQRSCRPTSIAASSVRNGTDPPSSVVKHPSHLVGRPQPSASTRSTLAAAAVRR